MYIVPVPLSLYLSAIFQVAIFSGPGRFTITSVSIGACKCIMNDIIKVTYMKVSCVTIYSYWPCMTLWCNALLYRAVLQVHLNCMKFTCTWPLFQNEPDCPGYPTERYTVDVDGVQVADLTADAVQSLSINHANGSVTLSLPLNQPLPENAVTLNMTKYNTVPTNRSDDMGNIVTEMVTWGTSTVFGELKLITSDICIIHSSTIVNDDACTYMHST